MNRIAIGLCLALGLAACSSGVDAVGQDDVVAETESAATTGTKISFEALSFDVPSNVGTSTARKVFNTKAEFQAYFGRDVSVPVNFGKYSVAFYSAGQKNTGGFSAEITAIRLSSARALTVTTRLSSPGAGCFVTEAFTKPAVLVAFVRPTPAVKSVTFAKSDTVTDCNEPATCAATLCKPGTICTERSGTAECIAPVSCAATLCAVGTTCTEASGTAECVAPTSCAAALCPRDTYCYEKNGQASCIAYQTCESSSVTCGANEYCNNHSIQCFAAPCAPTAPVCTPGLTPCATVRCGSAHPQCVVTNGAASCK